MSKPSCARTTNTDRDENPRELAKGERKHNMKSDFNGRKDGYTMWQPIQSNTGPSTSPLPATKVASIGARARHRHQQRWSYVEDFVSAGETPAATQMARDDSRTCTKSRSQLKRRRQGKKNGLQAAHHIIHRLLSKTSPGLPKARSPLKNEAIARCVMMNLRQANVTNIEQSQRHSNELLQLHCKKHTVFTVVLPHN